MSRTVQFQDPGEGIHDGEVVEIHVSPGDPIDEGQVILVVETDKANFEVESPFGGRVEKVHVQTGDVIEVGQDLLTLEARAEEAAEQPDDEGEGSRDDAERRSADQDDEEGRSPDERDGAGPRSPDEVLTAAEEADAENGEPPDDEPRPREPAEPDRGPVPASPATRRIARELGVDLAQVTPSGTAGRVLAADVRAHAAEARNRPRDERGTARDAPALPDFTRFGPTRREPLRSVRRTIARRMAESWRTIPHVTHGDEADVTALEAFRRRQARELDDPEDAITLTALVVRAVAAVLREFPRFNTSLDPEAEELVYKESFHIGVAVDTERGLLVPVVRDVDRKSVREVGRELAALAERARDADLTRGEMEGGTFTVTNVGSIGGTFLSPIINPPQVAILGLARMRREPRPRGDEERSRLILPLCLSFDHRVNDGADAARFTNRLIELLADPEHLAVNI